MGLRFGKRLGLSIVVGLVLSACLNKDGESASERLLNEVNTIDQYLSDKGITPVKDVNGVRMVISKLGNGYPAKILSNTVSSSINIDYVGRLFPDGAQFDAGTATGALHGYIDGWKIAFTTLPEGSEARIYIPSVYAYGTNGNGSIPGNSILEFDVKFKKIVRTSAELQRLAVDTVAINDYLAAKSITTQRDSTGFRYVVTEEGTGAQIGLYDALSFHITYRLLTDDSKVVIEFDSQPSGVSLNRAIDQGPDALKGMLSKLRVGSKATIYAPSLLGYGSAGASNGTQSIPANANLIMEIKDIKIVNQ